VLPFPLEIPLLQKYQWMFDFYAFYNRSLFINLKRLNRKVCGPKRVRKAKKYIYGQDFNVELIESSGELIIELSDSMCLTLENSVNSHEHSKIEKICKKLNE
jgi:hypothetical protein